MGLKWGQGEAVILAQMNLVGDLTARFVPPFCASQMEDAGPIRRSSRVKSSRKALGELTNKNGAPSGSTGGKAKKAVSF